MLPLFDENQRLDKSELVDFLANKSPRRNKAMLIPQSFNPETGDLETFVEHCERAETTDNITVAKSSTSDEDSDTKRKKKRSKFKEHKENSKKHRKKTPHFISLSVLKIKVTPLRSVTSSREGLNIKKIINMEKRITKRISKNLISCRQKLPTKGPSIKI